MEDFPRPTEAELPEEKSGKKKRRKKYSSGAFSVESWRAYKERIQEAGPEEEARETVERGVWWPGRWLRKFGSFFKKSMPVEMVPVKDGLPMASEQLPLQAEKPGPEAQTEVAIHGKPPETKQTEYEPSNTSDQKELHKPEAIEEVRAERAAQISQGRPPEAAPPLPHEAYQLRQAPTEGVQAPVPERAKEKPEKATASEAYEIARSANKKANWTTSALVLTELLQRRREHKQKRGLLKTKKALKDIKRQQQSQQQEQIKTRYVVENTATRHYVQEAIKTAQATRGNTEMYPANKRETPEVQSRQEAISYNTRRTNPNVVKPEVNSPKPEAVLHEVEQAAEKNIPIEKVYERRHEVKDDANDRAIAAAGLAKVGHSRYSGISAGHVSFGPKSPSAQQIKDMVQGNSMYGQAMRRGAMGAIALLVFLLIILLWR